MKIDNLKNWYDYSIYFEYIVFNTLKKYLGIKLCIKL